MAWAEFVLAFAAFFLSHAAPVRPRARSWLIARTGRRGFTIGYSFLSLVMLGWVIAAAGRAPYVGLWEPAAWQRHAALTAMLAACLLVALAAGRANPFSFGGPAEGFDPARPGVVRWSRHPLLAALALWAAAHLLANGDLAHIILFGSLALFAVLGRSGIDRRRRREMGEAWTRLAAGVRAGPILPRPASWSGAALRLAGGIALYAALLWLHPVLFGVSPLA